MDLSGWGPDLFASIINSGLFPLTKKKTTVLYPEEFAKTGNVH